jgi:hypothetical protein
MGLSPSTCHGHNRVAIYFGRDIGSMAVVATQEILALNPERARTCCDDQKMGWAFSFPGRCP